MIKKQKKEKIIRNPRAPKLSVKKGFLFSYKKPEELKNYLSGQGMILSREKTGLTQKQQRQLAVEIKRARHLALLPFIQSA